MMAEYSVLIYKYKLAMSTAKTLLREGIITEKDYARIDTIMTKKYGLSLDSIFRENSLFFLDNMLI